MTLPTGIRNKTALHILILLVFGGILVFFNYLNIPKYMTFDEIEFAKLALQLDKTGYVPYSTYATGHATFYFYIILLSFKLIGISKVALRLPSAISGVLDPVIFYLALRQFFLFAKRKDASLLSLIVAIFFLTSRWYFNFARFGFEATFLLFWELSSLYFILKYMNAKRNVFLVLSGVFAGLAYNSYQPGRLFFLIPAAIMLFDGFSFRNIGASLKNIFHNKTGVWKKISLFLLPFVLVVLPLTIYLTVHPDIRMYQLFYPGNHETALSTKISWFGEDVWKTVGMFFFKGDMNGRHNYTGKAALNPIFSLMLIVGMIVAIRKRKEIPSWVFGLWLMLSLIPTLVTYPWENPNMLRTVTATPTVAFFSGLAIMWALDRIKHFHNWLRNTLFILIIVVASISVIYEIRTYFLYQSKVFLESFEAKKELIYYINHPDRSVFEK